ncbi:hypothetical protein VE03_10387 [Pseudogymnoascus sp. 23342-1-I1]|nr:hypothetical protein VE03_10387 [Pseudogymnoascus sp. 23342-1-I1]
MATLLTIKARLVVRGDLQRYSIHDETYAATLASKTFRALMAITAYFDLASDLDFAYPRTVLSSSPLKLDSSSGSSGHRKRSYNAPFHDPASHSTKRKRFRFSPSAGRSISQGHTSWKDQHQLGNS